MKKRKLLLNTAILLGLSTGAVYLYDADLLPKWYKSAEQAITGSTAWSDTYVGDSIQAEEWTDAVALRQKLADQIKATWESLEPTDVKNALTEPQKRLLLAQWMLANTEVNASKDAAETEAMLHEKILEMQTTMTGLAARRAALGGLHYRDERREYLFRKQIKQFGLELDQPRLLKQVLETENKKQLLQALSNNLDWLEQMVYTGQLLRPAKVLAILSDIEKQHPDMQSNRMVRDIATATALEFAKSGWLHDVAVNRADYFISHWKNDDLNIVFDSLPFWERRMVCGSWGNHAFGGRPSFEWALENMHLPADRYTQDCPHHLYRLHNLYGDSIHGPHYVEPYADLYEDNMCQFVQEVGGICGNLSKLCTMSALANGIPALTTGEPGHCSYVVKVGNKWEPGYSLDWRRDLQWLPWPGMTVFSCLHMAEELFSDAEQDKTMLSQAYRVLAAVHTGDNADKALQCYQEAIKAQPLNMFVWREYAAFLAKYNKKDSAAWLQMNQLVCDHVASRYPEVAAKLLEQSVYPGLKEALGNKSDTIATACLAFWNNVDRMGPARWRIEDMLNLQMGYISGKNVNDSMLNFYVSLLKAQISNKMYSPVIFSWGNELAGRLSPRDSARLLDSMTKGMGGAAMDDDSKALMLGSMILGAERAKDMTSFQAISKTLPDIYLHPKKKLPLPEAFAGQLMSRGGLLWASSTSQWDDPCKHWGILEPDVGGEFHTNAQKNPWVVVQLPRQTKVTGVTAVGRASNAHRMDGMVLQVSETGRDDDWHNVAVFTKPKARNYRANTGDNLPVAKYIRIYRTSNSSEPFHLEGIYVYGFPSA